MKPLHVLHVASEVVPFSKTGGLGDVVAGLPRALAARGLRVTIVAPRYRSVDTKRFMLAKRLTPLEIELPHGRERLAIFEGKLPGSTVQVYLLDHRTYDRDGLYGEGSTDYPDNGIRFALLCRGALELIAKLEAWPDIVHAHDWQAGLALLYAKERPLPGPRPPRTVFTIHNLAFQGLMPKAIVPELGLDWSLFTPERLEFFDLCSFLKAGISSADMVTTVSPSYAREIQTPAHGAGLDGFLRMRPIIGIQNGIDTLVWSPAHDPFIAAKYDASDPSPKAECKAALQSELGLPVRRDIPLVGSISRHTEQKGFDLITQAGDELVNLGAQYVFLGTGEPRYEDALRTLAHRYPNHVAVRSMYDDPLAHRIEAGCDYFLMPSQFEPCGLNQMYSQRYGTLPIVRAVGGLNDAVVDFDELTATGTGFKFVEYAPAALVACVKRALSFYRTPLWRSVVLQAMRVDNSWKLVAKKYIELYEKVLTDRLA